MNSTRADSPEDSLVVEAYGDRRKWLRRLVRGLQVVFGLGLGLVLIEQAFAIRDQRAFPHVNFYVADPVLGVRLEPGASMGFKLREESGEARDEAR